MSPPQATILVIDDEPQTGMIFEKILREGGYRVVSETTGEEGLSRLKKGGIDLIFLDLRLPVMDGVETLRHIAVDSSSTPVVIMTAYQTVSSAVECMKLGALDYLIKPLQAEQVKEVVQHILKIKNRRASLKGTRLPPEELIGTSSYLVDVRNLVKKVGPTDLAVLLLGESGTGKEIVARAIHENSLRRQGPFVPVDCGAIPESLMESELFGYEKGAFTGAEESKPGRFELANGGTLFLDEIGNLPLSIQAKLLRVLQEPIVERLGGRKPIRIDTRIVAATNRDLEAAVKEGDFREDLYHRIKVFAIELQPLRRRLEDMDPLIVYFVKRFNAELGKNVKGVNPQTLELFRSYRWPGNIRELANVLRSAVLLADGVVEPEHLPTCIRFSGSHMESPASSVKDEVLRSVVKRVEREHILTTLKKTGWNRAEAARVLGVDYKTLYNKMKEHKISETNP